MLSAFLINEPIKMHKLNSILKQMYIALSKQHRDVSPKKKSQQQDSLLEKIYKKSM